MYVIGAGWVFTKNNQSHLCSQAGVVLSIPTFSCGAFVPLWHHILRTSLRSLQGLDQTIKYQVSSPLHHLRILRSLQLVITERYTCLNSLWFVIFPRSSRSSSFLSLLFSFILRKCNPTAMVSASLGTTKKKEWVMWPRVWVWSFLMHLQTPTSHVCSLFSTITYSSFRCTLVLHNWEKKQNRKIAL